MRLVIFVGTVEQIGRDLGNLICGEAGVSRNFKWDALKHRYMRQNPTHIFESLKIIYLHLRRYRRARSSGVRINGDAHLRPEVGNDESKDPGDQCIDGQLLL